MTGTATLVRQMDNMRADAALYRVSPPMVEDRWDEQAEDMQPVRFEWVIVSALHARLSGPKTYIFGANEAGEIIDWQELPGSYRGGLQHARALSGAGYRIVAHP